jgi:hypothetical protein
LKNSNKGERCKTNKGRRDKPPEELQGIENIAQQVCHRQRSSMISPRPET